MAQKSEKDASTLSDRFAELNKFAKNQDYAKALKVANRIVHENPKNETAFQCKIVCLIKLDKFDEALTQINKNKELTSYVAFEKAYCEYRLNRTEEALNTLRGISQPDTRTKELLAQVLYRLEEYQECYDLYRDVIKNSEDDYDEERQTNLSAVIASLQLWEGKNMDDPGLEENSYELCYNMACYLIGKEDYKGAEKKLKKAEDYCKQSFEDDPDVTEEEIEEELGIIRVQLAFVLQKLGRNEEALQLYNQVLKSRPDDIGLLAVASNNVVTLNKDQNVFDSKKKMKLATGDNLKQKLTSRQKCSINVNQCLLHMYTNQGEQCHSLAAKLKKQYPDMASPVLIEAAQFVREKKTEEAKNLLNEYAKSHPDKALTTKLVMAQLYLTQGHVYEACNSLKSLGDLRYKPGVVSALVTLYLNQEDKDSASEVLVQTVDWYNKNQPQSPSLPVLMRANADFQLKNGSPQQAAKMLEELRKKKPDDPRILAQLITAYSQFDPEKAKLVSKDLPSVEKIAQDIDVDQLESSFSTLGPKYMKKKTDTAPSPGPAGDVIVKKKKKKKKKGKMPKNPDAEIDPERWLPRKERSYYRGKRRDKRKEIGKGPQGATSGITDSLDASKTPGSDSSSPKPSTATTTSPTTAPSPAPAAQGPRQQKPAQAQKRKKKGGKGGKW
ncbi:signal recognition particle subunit SRP72-like [Saccostrea echinata]|uniref:signal recognition particle subunit SRP72-like n=1 Tax=Saccostrea echinata TaxID=191078 RepID=UPI002A8108C7|nr:signal recognition particle subunit SRP72-like [Saccostrea echinata]